MHTHSQWHQSGDILTAPIRAGSGGVCNPFTDAFDKTACRGLSRSSEATAWDCDPSTDAACEENLIKQRGLSSSQVVRQLDEQYMQEQMERHARGSDSNGQGLSADKPVVSGGNTDECALSPAAALSPADALSSAMFREGGADITREDALIDKIDNLISATERQAAEAEANKDTALLKAHNRALIAEKDKLIAEENAALVYASNIGTARTHKYFGANEHRPHVAAEQTTARISELAAEEADITADTEYAATKLMRELEAAGLYKEAREVAQMHLLPESRYEANAKGQGSSYEEGRSEGLASAANGVRKLSLKLREKETALA